jgi:hypothetical protein
MARLVHKGEGGAKMPRVLKRAPRSAIVMLASAAVYALALVLSLYYTGHLVDYFTQR